MPDTVPDWGLPTSRLVLIGEAPGKDEMAQGKPFVGASGKLLESMWRKVGLKRDDFYITNVVPYLPQHIDRVPSEEMDGHIAALRLRLTMLPTDAILVPVGNYALYALTGKGCVAWNKRDGKYARPGILDWRGSVLRAEGHTIIPTLHPAFVLRVMSMYGRTLADWQRIAAAYRTGAPSQTAARHITNPSDAHIEAFCDKARAEPERPIAFDLETPRQYGTEYLGKDGVWRRNVRRDERDTLVTYKSGAKKGQPKSRKAPGEPYIGCIGLALSPHESIVINRFTPRILSLLNELFITERPIIGQNIVSFDLPWIGREWGIIPVGPIWDTRYMHHVLDPRESHDLAFLASIYTTQPFWKHEAKDPDEVSKYASNSEALWTYCGIDTTTTYAIAMRLHDLLVASGQWGFYTQHYSALALPLVDMTLHGVRVSTMRMDTDHHTTQQCITETIAAVNDAAQMDLMAKTGLSPDKLRWYLYGAKGFAGRDGKLSATNQKKVERLQAFPTVSLPPVWKRGTGTQAETITCDELAIRKLVKKYPEKCGEVGQHLLTLRRLQKQAEFLDPSAVDTDGRMRCAYNMATDAGRLSSHETPWRTGRNLQNVDRELRHIYVPDEGV